MAANTLKTETPFRNEEVTTIGSSSTSDSLVFGQPSQEFHVISRSSKTTDQRGRPRKRETKMSRSMKESSVALTSNDPSK